MSNVKFNWDKGSLSEIEKKLSAAIYQEATQLMSDSQAFVPVDTGTLRSTAFTDQPSTTGSKISVKAGYGGPATKINPKTGEASTDYAVKVHEDLQAHHDVGEAKFLEKPARKLSQKFDENVRRRVNI